MTSVATSLSPEQLSLRREGIGASEIGAVLGLDPYRTALDVYLDKLGLVEPMKDNHYLEWGRRLEPVMADAYAERHGIMLSRPNTTLRHPEHPWVLATPDALALTDDPNVTWGLECKNRSAFLVKLWGDDGTDEVPHSVAVQCHWSMAVTGLARWDVAVLLGGNDFRCYTLARDEEVIGALIDAGRKFWHENVLARVEPPLTGSSAHKWLAKKYPMHSDEIVTVGEGDPIYEKLTLLAVAKDAMKETAARAERLEAEIKDFIGARCGVEATCGTETIKCTWKHVKESEVKAHTRPAHRRFSLRRDA